MEKNIQLETFAQLIVRMKSKLRPSIENIGEDIFPDNGPTTCKLIEISGDGCTGKTLLLYEIITRCILPIEFNGKNASIVFLNLDNKFSMLQFLKVLEKNIKYPTDINNDNNRKEIIQNIIENSLKRLIIFTCYSSEEYELTLIKLDKILYDNENIAIIAIDSLSAFYWIDCEEKTIKMETHFKKLAMKLKNICNENQISIVYTQPSYYASKQQEWSSLADYKFELSKFNNIAIASDGSDELFEQIFTIKMNHCGQLFDKLFKIDEDGIQIL